VPVGQAYRLAFYGYAALLLDIHSIEHLVMKAALINKADVLYKAVGQC
jgi:hypothetical protein